MGSTTPHEARALRRARRCHETGLRDLPGPVALQARHGTARPFPPAPEPCVELRSPSNTEAETELETRLCLAAGAIEPWIVDEDGRRQVFDAAGEQPARRCVSRLHD